MPTEKLYKGTLMRQILKGKKKVRIVFLPDNPEVEPQITVRANDIGEKVSWKLLLEKGHPLPAEIDIDTGIIFLRFNKDMTSGTATFLPADKNQLVIINPFLQAGSGTGIPDSSPEDFANCVDNKTDNGVNLAEAIAVCLPRLAQ